LPQAADQRGQGWACGGGGWRSRRGTVAESATVESGGGALWERDVVDRIKVGSAPGVLELACPWRRPAGAVDGHELFGSIGHELAARAA